MTTKRTACLACDIVPKSYFFIVCITLVATVAYYVWRGEVPAPITRAVRPLVSSTVNDILSRVPKERRAIDCSEDVRGCDIRDLATTVSYVGRYYNSTNRRKCLTRVEAIAISDAGMRIFVVFQNGARSQQSFSAAGGERDGEFAWNFACAVGQPSGSAIFFAVDYPPSDRDLNSYILPYFEHVVEGMQTARQHWALTHPGKPAQYAIGVWRTEDNPSPSARR